MANLSAQRRLSLDESVSYEIRVSGRLEANWSDWVEAIVRIEEPADGVVTSTISGVFDQAALHGVLRRLYSLGFPLISVRCRGYGAEDTVPS